MVVVSGFLGIFTPTLVESQQAKPDDVCEIFKACLSGTEEYKNNPDIISDLTTNIVVYLIYIAAALAVFFIVLGGYKMIASNGDEAQIKAGRSMLLYAVLGLVVCIVSFTIVTVVYKIVSTTDLNGAGGSSNTSGGTSPLPPVEFK